MGRFAPHLRANLLRHICVVFYDVASLFASLFFASLLFSEQGIGFFASLFGEDLVFVLGALAMWLLITLGLRLSAIHLSSFGILDAMRLAAGVAVFLLFALVYTLASPTSPADWRFAVLFVGCFFLLAGAGRTFRRLFHLARRAYLTHIAHGERVLIVGAGDAGAMLLRELRSSSHVSMHAVAFADDKETLQKTYINGVRVVGTTEDIPSIVKKYAVTKILIAMPSAPKSAIRRIHDVCVPTRCPIEILPGIYQFVNGQVSVSSLREVDVADLLGREQTRVDLDSVMGYIEGKTVLVTGGGGSIGSELCRQISTHRPKKLLILDIYENNAYEIEQEIRRHRPELDVLPLIASVRDEATIDRIFAEHRPEVVFHAAAHKHVPLMEISPAEAVKNNVFGTRNVVLAADRYGVGRFVMISTDKAVNPTNVMGATKRICEMIVQSAARHSRTEFVAVRFGNVLGSNGSVIPLFRRQIAEGGPVTLTHRDIIRYFMTIPEAVSLVLQAGAYAKGGEIFVLDMGEPVRIYDLACNLIRLSGLVPGEDIEIKITGLRPGEKLYEERLLAEEGLLKTANDSISIGKPIEFDEEAFEAGLRELRAAAEAASPDLRALIAKIVPTYRFEA